MPEENASSETNTQDNHRSVLDSIVNGTPITVPAPVIPPTPTAPITPAPAAAEVQNDTPTPPAETPSTNIYESLAEISNGAIKSEDDFKTSLEKLGKYSDLESQLTTLAQERDALKNANPFANEYLKKLNELHISGADPVKIDLFQRINSLGDTSQLSSLDALKWQLREKYGLTDEQAEVKIKTSYKLDDTIYSADEVMAANVDVKIAGDEAKGYLKGLQASFETPKPAEQAPAETQEQIAQKSRDYELKLTPVVQSIEQELPGYFSKINTNGLQGDKAVTTDFPIPDDVKTDVSENVKAFALNNQIDLNKPENVTALKEYATNLTKIRMFDKAVIHAANTREEALRLEFNNPSTIQRGDPNPAGVGKTSREAAASRIAETA